MAKPSKSNLRFIKDPVLAPYYIQLDDHCYIAQKSTFSEAGTRVPKHHRSLSAS